MVSLKIWWVYYFHDTGDTAAVKRIHAVNDNLRLKPDAANLAAVFANSETTPFTSAVMTTSWKP